MTKRTLLVDGDIIVYQAAAADETPINWGDGLWTLHSEEEAVFDTISSSLEELQEELCADDMIIALTDAEENWRKDVYPAYKSNRKETRKPLTLKPAREFVLENYNTYLRPRLEGDDIMGILATHPKIVPGEKIIVSIDKDMQTIPGKLLNLRKAREAINEGEAESLEECIVTVTEEQADRYHLLQTLTGDTTDGYPGCPGIGAVRAERILDKAKGSLWEAVVETYEKAKLDEEDALIQARVARILRGHEYDFKKKEPVLWTPTT